MKVSVAFIAYNHVKYVRQSLEGVLAQRADFDWEVVIGDDCSTDGTGAIIAEFRDRYPDRIRVLPRERNLGMVRNVEDVLSACTGEYVAMLEGDDFWVSPDKLRLAAEFFDANPSATVCFHPVKYLYEDGRSSHTFPRNPLPERLSVHELLRDNFIQTCSVMLRRSAMPLPFPDFFSSLKLLDWPICILAADKGGIGQIAGELATYRVHVGGVWSMKPAEQIMLNVIGMMELLDAYFGGRRHAAIRETVLDCYGHLLRLRCGNPREIKSKSLRWVWDCPKGGPKFSRAAVRVLISIYAPWILSSFRWLKGTPAANRP
ncbi:MAG TPA: glycosyltransferase [Humisphaera sp.]|nr:glycosyltransferase [Humisphaera sp.]